MECPICNTHLTYARDVYVGFDKLDDDVAVHLQGDEVRVPSRQCINGHRIVIAHIDEMTGMVLA